MTRVKLARALLKPINTSAVIILGIYTLVWGVWTSIPEWSLFEQGTIYHVMAAWAPEYVWGVIAMIIGATITAGVLKSSHKLLKWGTAMAFYFWTLAGCCMWFGNWHGMNGWTSTMLAAYAGFVNLNLRVNSEEYLRGLE